MNPSAQAASITNQIASLGHPNPYVPLGAADTGNFFAPALAPQVYNNPNSGGQVQGTSTTATTSGGGTTGGGGSTTTGPSQAELGQLAYAQNLVGQANNLYNQIYGPSGDYATGLTNAQNSLQAGYLPQYQQVANQAQSLGQQLDWNALANGTGASSYAGMQQQNLAANAGAESSQILAQQQKDQDALAKQAASQKATDLSNQSVMNSELANLKTAIPQDTTGAGIFRLGDFTSGLGNTLGTLSGDVAGNQPAGQLFNSLQAVAPSQIFNPQTLQTGLQSISQSSLPNSLQGILSNAYTNANSPTNPGYWSNYLKQTANPAQ